MRVFITGASGFIGTAVVPELVAAGHRVTGLARSEGSAAALTAAGVEVQRGSLDDLDTLRAAADAADGVIHLAFRHDAMYTGDFLGAAASDLQAIETMGGVLRGSDRPLVITAGLAGLAAGRVSTEEDQPDPQGIGALRARSATAALDLAEHGVRSSVARLAASVHDVGDRGFIWTLIQIARARGVSGYIGDGANRWPTIHRTDAARLYRLAVEQAPAGSVLHGVGEEGVAIREIAEVIGRHLYLPVVSVPSEDAAEHFGWLAGFLGADAAASSTRTRELLGWEPTGIGLVADLEAGHYFADVD